MRKWNLLSRALQALVVLQLAVAISVTTSTPAMCTNAVHALLVWSQNWLARSTARRVPPVPQSSSRRTHCSELMPDVHLLKDVLPDRAFERVRRKLPSAAHRDGLCYDTAGRKSCVLSAAQTSAVAPAVRALHHDHAWASRLSRAVGVNLHPLDDRRFRMAFTTHLYTTGSFNAAHRDSSRTDAKVWTVIYSIDNNSSAHLHVAGQECTIPDNAALVFDGGEQLHWVPMLQPAPGKAGGVSQPVQRTIIFLEYTVLPSRRVRWWWPWDKTFTWAERVFFQ